MTQTAKRQLSVRLSVFLAAVCTVFLLIGGAAEADGPPAPAIEYVVTSGDSLWSVATAHAADGQDLRAMISEIRSLSGLSNSTIFPGQVLLIPGT